MNREIILTGNGVFFTTEGITIEGDTEDVNLVLKGLYIVKVEGLDQNKFTDLFGSQKPMARLIRWMIYKFI
jgi:hypothetical protein